MAHNAPSSIKVIVFLARREGVLIEEVFFLWGGGGGGGLVSNPKFSSKRQLIFQACF